MYSCSCRAAAGWAEGQRYSGAVVCSQGVCGPLRAGSGGRWGCSVCGPLWLCTCWKSPEGCRAPWASVAHRWPGWVDGYERPAFLQPMLSPAADGSSRSFVEVWPQCVPMLGAIGHRRGPPLSSFYGERWPPPHPRAQASLPCVRGTVVSSVCAECALLLCLEKRAAWDHAESHAPVSCSTDSCHFSSRIGRIAGRLPRALADDVVGSVLDCFR